jgi:hypothetical protein
MELEGSLPCPQMSTTQPYAVQDTSQHNHTPFKTNFNITLPHFTMCNFSSQLFLFFGSIFYRDEKIFNLRSSLRLTDPVLHLYTEKL